MKSPKETKSNIISTGNKPIKQSKSIKLKVEKEKFL